MRQRLCAALLAAIALAPAPAQVPDLYDPDTVRDLRLSFQQPDWWTQLLNNYATHTDIAADLAIDNVTLHGVGVRFRGATSYVLLPPGAQKRSFALELDWQVPGQDLWGYSNLNLNNGLHDPSFLRDFLGYLVARRHGAAPKCNFVRLHLNGVYWGIYINVQQPNKDMMRQWFRSRDGNRYRGVPTTGGFASGRCALTWLGSAPAAWLQAYQAKQGDGSDLMQLCYVLNNTPAAQLQAALPPVFAVDAMLRYAAVMNVITNTDSYAGSGKEHFLYHDEVHGDFHVLPFDLNDSLCGSETLDPWAFTADPARPALARTLQFAGWRERYKAHCRTVVEQTFNTAWLSPRITQYHNLIAADVAADTRKLYPTSLFTANLGAPVVIDDGYGPVTLPGLLPLVANRSAFLQAHPDLGAPRASLANLGHAPAAPDPTQAIAVSVRASGLAAQVRLWHRAVGPFAVTPMFDDGLHGDGAPGDGIFGAILGPRPPGTLLDYYVEAATASGLATFLPANAELGAASIQIGWPVAASPIAINEFVAQNVQGAVDEQGQHEDWLELYNRASTPVDVSGMWLSDTQWQPKWRLPAGTVMAGNGVLRVWCDEDLGQGPLHANFKLSAGGEAVALFAANGQTLLDWFVFGPQTADVSTGRIVDGGLPWVTFPAPTWLARNAVSPCGARRYGAQAAGTHGSRLDAPAQPRIGSTASFQLTAGPPGGLAVFALATAPSHVDLQPFGGSGEVLLLDQATLVIAATLTLGPQGSGVHQVAIPNRPLLAGVRLCNQAFTLGAVLDSSWALEVVVCP